MVNDVSSPTGPMEVKDPNDLVSCSLVLFIPDSIHHPVLDINNWLEWEQLTSLEYLLSFI